MAVYKILHRRQFADRVQRGRDASRHEEAGLDFFRIPSPPPRTSGSGFRSGLGFGESGVGRLPGNAFGRAVEHPQRRRLGLGGRELAGTGDFKGGMGPGLLDAIGTWKTFAAVESYEAGHRPHRSFRRRRPYRQRVFHPGNPLGPVRPGDALCSGASLRDEDRDRFILSKGHGALAHYVVLAEKGFFPRSELSRFGASDGILGGHPDRDKVPGIEASTGSLGMACPTPSAFLWNEIRKIDRRVFVW